MSERLFLASSATADGAGTATFSWPTPPAGSVWTGSISVADAPPAATLNVTVASQPWGQWQGVNPSPAIQAMANEVISVAAAGLLPGQTYSALLLGAQEPDDDVAAWLAPAATVPQYTQRFLGSVITNGQADGQTDITGIQPSDQFLILEPTGVIQGTSGAIGFRSEAHAGVVGGATISVSVPAGTSLNDVMVATVACLDGRNTITAPAGWNLINTTDGGGGATGPRMSTYYRVATGAEPASYTWTEVGTASVKVASIATYTGVNTSAPIDASGIAFGADATNATAPSITTVTANTKVIATVAFVTTTAGVSTTPPAGMTQRYDFTQVGAAFDASLADVDQAGTGATGTKVATLNASVGVRFAAATIALRPITGTPTARYADAVQVTAFLQAGDSSAVGVLIGSGLVGESQPLSFAIPASPGITAPFIRLFWSVAMNTRVDPTNFRVYAGPAPLPPAPFPLNNYVYFSGGPVASGTYSFFGTNQIFLVRKIVLSVRGAARAELQFAIFPVLGFSSAFQEPFGIVGAASGANSVVYEFADGEFWCGSWVGFQGGNACNLVVTNGTFDQVEVVVYGSNRQVS